MQDEFSPLKTKSKENKQQHQQIKLMLPNFGVLRNVVLVKVSGFCFPRLTVEMKTILMMDSYCPKEENKLMFDISC